MKHLLDIPKFLRSFTYALRGIGHLVKREQNARIHAVAGLIALFLCFYFKVSRMELAVVLVCIGLVFSLETANTAVEKLLDIVHPQSHAQIAYIKDALAGAVLVAAIIALCIAGLVFLPHLGINL